MQQTSNPDYVGRGTYSSFKYMHATEGMVGYFKGNGLTVLKIAPFSAFEFYFYEVFKGNLFPGK